MILDPAISAAISHVLHAVATLIFVISVVVAWRLVLREFFR